MPARHRPASQSSPGPTPDTCSLTGKNRGEGQFHGVEPHDMQTCKTVQAVPRVMQKNTSCSTCHAKKQAVPHVMQKNKLFRMSCKNHAKNKLFHMLQKNKLFHMLQKPCKNHAKCGAYGAPTRRTLTLPGFLAICAICAISHKASH